MATIYRIRCPKCGHEFEEMKGPLMSDMGRKLPASRDEKKPFRCPACGRRFYTEDRDFPSHVIELIMAD